MMADMTSLSIMRSRGARWAVPAVAAVAVIGAGPLVDAVTASAHGSLPPRTAAQLLADVSNARVRGLIDLRPGVAVAAGELCSNVLS